MMLSKVLLPDPEGPTIASVSPASTVRERSFNTVTGSAPGTGSYSLLTWDSRNSGSGFTAEMCSSIFGGARSFRVEFFADFTHHGPPPFLIDHEQKNISPLDRPGRSLPLEFRSDGLSPLGRNKTGHRHVDSFCVPLEIRTFWHSVRRAKSDPIHTFQSPRDGGQNHGFWSHPHRTARA